ncbi:hypothetical protein ACEQUB_01486 [Ralstonia syzygii]
MSAITGQTRNTSPQRQLDAVFLVYLREQSGGERADLSSHWRGKWPDKRHLQS